MPTLTQARTRSGHQPPSPGAIAVVLATVAVSAVCVLAVVVSEVLR